MPASLPNLRVGVIGMGRVGPSIASALRANGHEIVAVNARSEAAKERAEAVLPGIPQLSVAEVVAAADLIILAVSDPAIRQIVEDPTVTWRPGQVLAHVSGIAGLDVLEQAAAAGVITMALHPAMTFSGWSLDVSRLDGCPFAVTAPPLVMPLAEALVAEIGGTAQVIDEDQRPLYHAGLSHAANHLVTVIAQAEEILRTAGIADPGDYLRPLVNAALEGALNQGMGALTGPVQRGDTATVQAHLDALHSIEGFEVIENTYRCLSEATGEELRQQ